MAPSKDDEGSASLEQYDDDSSEEESVDLLAPSLPQKERVPSALPLRPPSAGASAPSPATQTLDNLSQHDALGGGDLLYGTSEKETDVAGTESRQAHQERQESPTRETPPNPGSRPIDNSNAASSAASESCNIIPDHFMVKQVSLEQPGRLGMTVARGMRRTCYVREVVAGTQAEAAGIQKEDVLFRMLDNGGKVPISYDEVITWPSQPRPIAFSIARTPDRLSSESGDNGETRNEHVHSEKSELGTKAVKPPQVLTTPKRQTTASRGTTSVHTDNENELPVPFCEGCKKKSCKSVDHHTLCPKHPRFYASGAKEKLEKLRQGVQMGCKPCEFEYERGRRKYEKHTCARGRTAAKIQNQSPLTVSSQPVRPENVSPLHKEPSSAAKRLYDTSDSPDTSPVSKATRKILSVPFCRACNEGDGRSTLLHHALCPQHPQFDNSGADDTLELILSGVEVGCKACEFQYQYGRINKSLCHARQCERRKKNKSQIEEKTKSAPGVSSKPNTLAETSTGKGVSAPGAAKKGRKKTATGKGSKTSSKSRKKVKTGCSQSAPSGRGKNESDAPKLGRAIKKKESRKRTAGDAIAKESSKKARNKKSKVKKDACTNVDPQARRRDSDRETRSQPQDAPGYDGDTRGDESILVASSKRTRKAQKQTEVSLVTGGDPPLAENPEWVSFPNPYGAAGHVEGDVVLFCPSGGFTHHETIAPTARFSLDIFGSRSSYLNSHASPQDGYHVVKLTRDGMAFRPWGFTFRRHDFGGACLVGSVEPQSPAAAAVHVGTAEHTETRPNDGSAGLCVNDMILCVNGKDVGGMTETGLSIELEVAGPQLVLVVSRYKHSSVSRFARGESRAWSSLDDSEDAARLKDWTEVGEGEKEDGNGGVQLLSTSPERPKSREASISLETIAHASEKMRDKVQELPGRAGLLCSDENSYANPEDEATSVCSDAPASDTTPLRTVRKEQESQELQLLSTSPERPKSREASISLETIAHASEKMHDNVQELPGRAGLLCSDENSHANPDDEATSVCSDAPASDTTPLRTARKEQESQENAASDEGDWEEDDNPWLGCVCGEIHPSPIPVFWIQCDDCDAWYSVSKRCIGFGEEEVETMGSWSCQACSLHDSDENKFAENGSQGVHGLSEYELLRQKNIERNNARLESLGLLKKQNGSVENGRKRASREKEIPLPRGRSGRFQTPPSPEVSNIARQGKEGLNASNSQPQSSADSSDGFEVTNENMSSNTSDEPELMKPGTVVFVEERTWPGSNKLGGVGKVIKVRITHDGILYDVRYSLGGKEIEIEAEYVTRHDFISAATSARKRFGSQNTNP